MNENKITITLDEYKTLLLMSAKAVIIKRMVENQKYVSMDDLKAVLEIEETEGERGNEAV
jgi:hypothetical protein